jgi:hypothetical protein
VNRCCFWVDSNLNGMGCLAYMGVDSVPSRSFSLIMKNRPALEEY